MTDLTAADFTAIVEAMLARIERQEESALAAMRAARDTAARLNAEIAALNARLLAVEVPMIRAYYRADQSLDGASPP